MTPELNHKKKIGGVSRSRTGNQHRGLLGERASLATGELPAIRCIRNLARDHPELSRSERRPT